MTTPRAQRRRTLVLILLATAAVALFSVLVPIQTAAFGTFLPAAMLLSAAVCAAPLLSLSHPRIAIVAFCVAVIALPLAVSGERLPAWPWPWSVPAMIAFTVFILVLTVRHGWRLSIFPWAMSNLGVLAALLVPSSVPATGSVTANLIVAASVSATSLLVGILIAGRLRVGDELSRSRELTAMEQSRRELVEERARIARELHDVVAHGMSVIQVQASTARYRLRDLPAGAAAEFDDIAAAARGSLTEMRRLLGVLRTEDQSVELAPQQGIADVPSLVDSIRRAGADVQLDLSGDPAGPPPGVQITAFRIVQESLSNAVRHAPGSDVTVGIDVADHAVTIRVRNGAAPGTGTASPAHGHGHGLRGMQERVALVTGSLIVGPDPGGGWSVSAVLPWSEPERAHA